MKSPMITTQQVLRGAVAGLLAWSTCLSALADYSSTVLSKSPKGYWQFNETNQVPTMTIATNYGSEGAVANGIYYNGATPEPSPIANATGENAVGFDGLSQRINIPYDAALNPASALSVEAWVRPYTSNNWDSFWYRGVVRSGGQGSGGGYMLQYNANAGNDAQLFKFTLYNSAGGYECFNTNYVSGTGFNIFATNNVWFHMVGTWSSSDSKPHLYVNGVELTNMNPSSVNGVAYTPTTSGFIRIADADVDNSTTPSVTYCNHPHPGGVAQVAVYSTQLSQDQIVAHYQAGLSALSNYSATILNDAPVGYWKLNESTFAAMPKAHNQSALGSALDATYCLGVAPVAGPVPPNYQGFDATNTALYLTNGVSRFESGGEIMFPPMRSVGDSTNLTIVALLKKNGATQQAACGIFGRRIPGEAKSAFQFDSTGTGLGYNWDDTSQQYNFTPGLIPQDGVWTFCALVITPTNAVVYMDDGSGLQAATNSQANLDPRGFTHVNWVGLEGGNFANSGRRFNGAIDSLAVWTNSLSRQDLLDLREAWIGSGLFLARQPASRPAMLGGKAKFTCVAGGSINVMPFTYQLQKNGNPVGPLSSSPTIVYTNVQLSDFASTFTIAVKTNGVASPLLSGGASLTRGTVPGTYSEAVESLRPDAYYRFGETVAGTIYDIAGGLDGVTNGLVAPAVGPQATDAADFGFETTNMAYDFNSAGANPAAGGYVACGGSGILFPNAPAVTTTIAGWIYPTASQIAFSGIYYSRCADYAALTFGPTGGYELGVSWNGNYNTHTYVYAYPGMWNFIAMVVTNDAATFYSYSTTYGWQSNTIYSSFPVRNLTGGTGTYIGSDPNTGLNRGVKGYVDEVAVFSKILDWPNIEKLGMAGVNVNLSIQPAGPGACRIGWSYGTLQSANSLNGPWQDIPTAAAPSYLYNYSGTPKYFRAYHN
jgi:hypothetical protein